MATLSTKPADIIAGSTPLLALTVKPYGVLGTVKRDDGTQTQIAEASNEATVIIDPAGLRTEGINGPSGAEDASAAIYKYIGLSQLTSKFPQDVKLHVKTEGDARWHTYSRQIPYNSTVGDVPCYVIHTAAPDLRDESSFQQAAQRLSAAYANVLRQCVLHTQTSCVSVIRLLPLSGSIFAGTWKSQLPELTAKAWSIAAAQLTADEIQALESKDLHLCIFMEAEFEAFNAAFPGSEVNPTLEVG